MIERQFDSMPQDQKERVVKAFEKNPSFFIAIAEEIQKEIKNGKDQMSAAQEVLFRHQEELKILFASNKEE